MVLECFWLFEDITASTWGLADLPASHPLEAPHPCSRHMAIYFCKPRFLSSILLWLSSNLISIKMLSHTTFFFSQTVYKGKTCRWRHYFPGGSNKVACYDVSAVPHQHGQPHLSGVGITIEWKGQGSKKQTLLLEVTEMPACSARGR